MLDPCKMAPTQCFIMRAVGGDAFGIIEIPKMASVPLEGFNLPTLASCHMDNHYTRCEWINGEDRPSALEIQFHWRDWICEGRPQSDGAGILFADGMGIEFEPVTREKALSDGILAYLDYYRVTKIQKHSNTSPLEIECKYVGKVEPGSDDFPMIPEEPADSQIIPQMRPSRLRRIAAEKALLEEKGAGASATEKENCTTVPILLRLPGSDDEGIVEAEFIEFRED